MLARVILVVLLGLSVEVRAQTSGEVSVELGAGGGGTTTGVSNDSDDSTDYALATADLAAGLSRPAPALHERGVHLCPAAPTLRGCAWIFTGLAADQPEGIGASARGEVFYARPARDDGGTSRAAALQVGTEAWAAWAGWRVAGRLDLQPSGDLRDPFWRSGRGIFERRTRLDFPALWALGNMTTQLITMLGHVDLGWRTAYAGGASSHAGFDRNVAITAMRLQHSRVQLDLAELRLINYGIDRRTVGADIHGTSASVFDANLASLDVRITDDWSARARGGLTSVGPISPFRRSGSTEQSEGPITLAPILWAEAEYANPSAALTLGGGTWTRLAPSGHAVDHGRLGMASFAHKSERLSLRGELALGKLRRILVGGLAPEATDPVGTRLWMGRASLAASLALAKGILLNATTWLERSDRDDPRWAKAATDVATRAGADLSAAWRFQRKPRIGSWKLALH